jgi:DNA-binding transcriptional LysR family regulator
MTLHQLRIFDVVSRHLNITKASAELHISQPSVFQQIKSLEESCGLRLYRKVGRGIELTADGLKLQSEAREILDRVETLQRKLGASRRSPETGPLLVGGSHVPSKSVLPLCLAAFKKNHPLVQITLQTKSSRSIETLVLNSELEIAIITHSSNFSELHYEPFRQEPVVFFVSARHPLASKKELTLAEIANESLIVHRGIRRGTGEITSDILKQIEEQGKEPNILMECSSGEAVMAAVIRGVGIGILMQAHLNDEIRRGEVKILQVSDINDLRITSFVIYQKDKALSVAAREFLDVLKRSARLRRSNNRPKSARSPRPRSLPDTQWAGFYIKG